MHLHSIIQNQIWYYLNTVFEINDIYVDNSDVDKQSVSIMTIHQSKGMEFKHVMIPFLASGSFPSRNYQPPYLDNIPEEKYGESIEVPSKSNRFLSTLYLKIFSSKNQSNRASAISRSALKIDEFLLLLILGISIN